MEQIPCTSTARNAPQTDSHQPPNPVVGAVEVPAEVSGTEVPFAVVAAFVVVASVVVAFAVAALSFLSLPFLVQVLGCPILNLVGFGGGAVEAGCDTVPSALVKAALGFAVGTGIEN